MESIDHLIRRSGLFLRRRDLLQRGYSDFHIRHSLQTKRIFRVRQGWYSVPDAPQPAIRAVRVGGRLTSISALESYGLRVPRRPETHVAVRRGACRLRRPDDRRRRLTANDPIRVHWIDRRGDDESAWRVGVDDALLAVLMWESRDIAVACCSLAMHKGLLSARRLEAVFRRAPVRVQRWRCLVSALDESHGETFARLWMTDAGIPFVQQAHVTGVGRLDFRVGDHTYIEIDGGQHDPEWTGDGESTWDKDHDRDTTVAIGGGVVQRYNYRQLYSDWPRVLRAIEQGLADDAVLTAWRKRHPRGHRAFRKRRRTVPKIADRAFQG